MSLQSAEEVLVMAERILGPTGSRRRRRFLSVPVLLVALAALFVVSGAQAVHATGLFQLDGDAQKATVPYGPGSAGVPGSTAGLEDWDNVCKKFAVAFDANNNTPGSDVCHPSSATILNGVSPTTASRATFITDAFNQGSDNIYKGGTDDGSINNPPDGIGGAQWQWKQAKPSPNKADIEQAFAAQYICGPASGTGACPNPAYANHTLLFFGGTRFANNGDTNIGLWFLHNAVTVAGAGSVTDPVTKVVSCPNPNGCGFTGSHTPGNCSLVPVGSPCTPGDLFVQSAFTSKPTIKVFEWVGVDPVTGKGNATSCVTNACDLQPVNFGVNPATGDNKCENNATSNDKGCAIVNDAATVGGTGEITSPWLFQDQSSKSPPNKIEDSELYEGGLDLTQLGFGDECISTVLLNTRSSGSSIDSTAQDFALGQFGGCTSKIATTAAGTATGSIGGGSVSSGTDSATVTVDGISTWSGTVDFYLCGPIDPQAATQVCDAGG